MYVKSDGNGGIVISKSLITLISLIAIMLGTVSSVVAYSVGVSHMAEQSLELAKDVKGIADDNKGLIVQNAQDIAVVHTQYTDIIRRLDSIEEKVDQHTEK